MALQLIARQTAGDPYAFAEQVHTRFQEYDYGEVRAQFDHPLTQSDIDSIQQQLIDQDVFLTQPVSTSGNTVRIAFQVRLFPLLAIVGVLGAGFLGWMSWDIYKETKSRLREIPAVILVVAGVATLYLLAKPAKAVATTAGKVAVARLK